LLRYNSRDIFGKGKPLEDPIMFNIKNWSAIFEQPWGLSGLAIFVLLFLYVLGKENKGLWT